MPGVNRGRVVLSTGEIVSRRGGVLLSRVHMTKTELIKKIKALTPAQLEEVAAFVEHLGRTTMKSFEEASAEVFEKHEELFAEMAR